jgi:hypothetical protein
MKLKITVLVFVLLSIGFIYYCLWGNPITRYESKVKTIEYLQEKYPQEAFIVDHIDYHPGERSYSVYVISESGILKGIIEVTDGKIIKDGLGLPAFRWQRGTKKA